MNLVVEELGVGSVSDGDECALAVNLQQSFRYQTPLLQDRHIVTCWQSPVSLSSISTPERIPLSPVHRDTCLFVSKVIFEFVRALESITWQEYQ